jgi:hypothetical protein
MVMTQSASRPAKQSSPLDSLLFDCILRNTRLSRIIRSKVDPHFKLATLVYLLHRSMHLPPSTSLTWLADGEADESVQTGGRVLAGKLTSF